MVRLIFRNKLNICHYVIIRCHFSKPMNGNEAINIDFSIITLEPRDQCDTIFIYLRTYIELYHHPLYISK